MSVNFPDELKLYLDCTYGLPAGLTLVGFQVHRPAIGWTPFAGGPGTAAGNCPHNSFNEPAHWEAGEYTAGRCEVGVGPDAVRPIYSDGSTRPASAIAFSGDGHQGMPTWGFRSGITGIGAAPLPTVPDNASAGLDEAREQLPEWMAYGIGVIAAVALLAGGAFIVTRLLHKAGYAGSLNTSSWDSGDDFSDEFGEASYSDARDDTSDESGDDQGDDDFLGLNGADDLSDDDGEETDDGNVGGGIGLGDVESCVSCGDDLEFGWDFDYCPSCGGV